MKREGKSLLLSPSSFFILPSPSFIFPSSPFIFPSYPLLSLHFPLLSLHFLLLSLHFSLLLPLFPVTHSQQNQMRQKNKLKTFLGRRKKNPSVLKKPCRTILPLLHKAP
uniref:Uncharacterized protein n=1 Tax=Cacopsylla melanoneura TaxID=428564 RepID=A0A8D8RYG6_9HEMI